MSTLLDDIWEGWAWADVKPAKIVDINSFGNIIFFDDHQQYWRIMPEELSITRIAYDENGYHSLQQDANFQVDWQMGNLVALANEKFGALGPNRCFCLKVPAVLGGSYDKDNIGVIAISELIRSSGDLAHQIKYLPDGDELKLTISD